jgi:hypothetical protein
MSDYHHRIKMQDTTCFKCNEGMITGSANAVSCNNPDCNFEY